MEWIISATTVFVCVVSARWLYLKVRNLNRDMFVSGVLGVDALLAAIKFLNPLANVFMLIKSSLTTIAGSSALLGGLLMFCMIVLLFVSLPHWLIVVLGVTTPWKRFIVRTTFAVFGIATTFQSFSPNTEDITVVVGMLMLTSLISGGYIIFYWRSIQDAWAVCAGYLLNIAMTTTLCWANWGINVFSNISGSPETMAAFVVSQVALITISNVLSTVTFFKKRLSYKIIYVWTAGLIIYSFTWSFSLLAGYTNKFELMTVRKVNQARFTVNAIQRMQSLGTERAGLRFDEASTLLETAAESGNLEQAQKALDSNEEHLRAIRNQPEVKLETPAGSGKVWEKIGNLKDSLPLIGGKKEPPPPPPPPPKLYTESHSLLEEGESWHTDKEFEPGKKLKISIVGGPVYKIQTKNYKSTFEHGDHIVPQLSEGWAEFVLKTKQPSRITVTQLDL